MKNILGCLLLLYLLSSLNAFASKVWVIPVQGAIGPATSDYITREITLAHEQQVNLVILQMDTPGGLDSAMRDIIKSITTSHIPIATWVGPSGARAASAGTYILLASHLAVMANATNLGAATPISIGMQGSKPESDKDQEKDVNNTKSPADEKKVPATTTLEKKRINDATAYIVGLAKLHGRNEQWAAKAVTEAASLDAQQALQKGVIDFIADDLKQIMVSANQLKVNLNGQLTPLQLENAEFTKRQPDWRFEFLAVLTNPNIAYMLMLIGVYGLLLEFYNPGIGLPGVLGGICLLLSMYALQMLPINYAGLALILLGIVLLIAEVFSPSFGILGLGGIISFVLGSVFLMDSDLPAFQIAKPLIAGFAIATTLFTFVILSLLLKVRRKKVVTGVNCLIGELATVSDDFNQQIGWVEVAGERWQAKSKTPVFAGQKVKIEKISGLWLQVLPIVTEQQGNLESNDKE